MRIMNAHRKMIVIRYLLLPVFLFILPGMLCSQTLDYPVHPEYKVISIFKIKDEPAEVSIQHAESRSIIRSVVGGSRDEIDFIGVRMDEDDEGLIVVQGLVVRIDGALFFIGFKLPDPGDLEAGVGVLNLNMRKNHIIIGDYEYTYGSVEWDPDERKYIFTDGVLITAEGENYQLYADSITIYYDRELSEVTKSSFSKLVTLVSELNVE